MRNRLPAILACLVIVNPLLFAATKNPWLDVGQLAAKPGSQAWVQPVAYRALALDVPRLRELLAETGTAGNVGSSSVPVELPIPLPDGSSGRFRIWEAPVMEPALASKYPEITTYLGQGIDDATATARLDWTPAGFHAQILSANGTVCVDPAFRGDASQYVSYTRNDLRAVGDFLCLLPEQAVLPPGAGDLRQLRSSGTSLRTYRLACAATGEYTTYHGGTVAAGLAAVVTAVNRVTGIYERDLAIRLVLVANNDLVIYTSGSTDPYSNTDFSAMLDENQANLDAVIGSANYDLGHVFSTGGGGLAGLACVCSATRKARGATGSSAPTGDAFWVDYVAHEMGHQFGANHTFNSVSGVCAGSRNTATAYEPGSGSTIMGYAGICTTNNLQTHSDAYFHTISFDEIATYTTTGAGSACPIVTDTTNSVPTVSAGAAYTIPQGTPFTLTASASDANGDAMTYCWEEMDLGPATTLASPDNGSSPLFRSYLPTTSTARTFSKSSDLLANRATPGERLPTTSRTLNFRVTVRDNRAGGGGVNTADTALTVLSGAGPFVITSPNTSATQAGPMQVTWNVAGTDVAPIGVTGVTLKLSTNGGTSFPIVLASNTPNDGIEIVTLPNILANSARLKLEAVGNIFFDYSNTNFAIVLPPMVSLNGATLREESCGGGNGLLDPGETVTVDLALRNTGTLSTTNLVVTLLETNGVVAPSGPQTFGALTGGGEAVTRPFTFTANGICGDTLNAKFQLLDGELSLGTLSVPFPLGTNSSATLAFTNDAPLTLPGTNTIGTASRYPSTIAVSGATGVVTRVTVTLDGLSHTNPDDLDVLLVGPGGQSAILMSDAGGTNDLADVTILIADNASVALPDSATITNGTFRPTNFGTGDTFAAPAPAAPYGTNLAGFRGLDPNGTWSLYIVDDRSTDIGSLAHGWQLSLTLSNPICCTGWADLAVGGTAVPTELNPGDAVTFALGVTNLGTAGAASVWLTNIVPAGFAVQSATTSQGTVAANGNILTADLGALAPGASATLTVTARAQGPGYWTNSLRAVCDAEEPVSTNNDLQTALFINAPPSLVHLADLSVHAQMLVRLTNQATDADLPAQSLEFSLGPGAPTGTALDALSGILTWTPSDAQTGTYPVAVQVRDNFVTPASDSMVFTIKVAPRPQLGQVIVSGGAVTLTWPSLPGVIYQPQFKDDLDQPEWTNLGANLPAAGTSLSVTDASPATGQRFYRVLVVQ